MSKEKKELIYRGIIKIGDTEINCVVTENGTRLISQFSMNKAFNRGEGGGSRNLPKIIDLKCLEPFIDNDLRGRVTNLVEIEGMKAFHAELIPDICEVWLKARDADVLTEQQKITAQKAEIIMRALSKIGIIALIDEATGYQHNRKKDALRLLLEQYISEGLQKWLKRFPDRFFEELDKLYNNEKTTSRKRPQYYGKFINKYIYEPIEEGYVKVELNKLNITDKGKRKARFHQWLSEFGINQLTVQIGRVMGIMEISDNLKDFEKHARRQKGLAVQEDLFLEENKENSKIIQNIQNDNLEFNNNDNFEHTLKKISLNKKIT